MPAAVRLRVLVANVKYNQRKTEMTKVGFPLLGNKKFEKYWVFSYPRILD